jgi:Dockerin type I domain
MNWPDAPSAVPTWPNLYFDQNGDGLATALDALRVINEISRQSNGAGEGERVLPALPIAVDSPVVVQRLNVTEEHQIGAIEANRVASFDEGPTENQTRQLQTALIDQVIRELELDGTAMEGLLDFSRGERLSPTV